MPKIEYNLPKYQLTLGKYYKIINASWFYFYALNIVNDSITKFKHVIPLFTISIISSNRAEI